MTALTALDFADLLRLLDAPDTTGGDVAEWLTEHVGDSDRVGQFLFTVPRISALLVRTTQGLPAEGSGESWALLLPDNTEPEDDAAVRAAQLVAAGLNDDRDAIAGIIAGIFDDETGETAAHVVMLLCGALRGVLSSMGRGGGS